MTDTDHKFERVVNFRDFGGCATHDGGRVRRGVLFRSAHLAEATDADLAVLERLGVQLVIDFRGPTDKEQEGHNRLPPGVRELCIPMYDPAQANDPRIFLFSAPPEDFDAAAIAAIGDDDEVDVIVDGELQDARYFRPLPQTDFEIFAPQ